MFYTTERFHAHVPSSHCHSAAQFSIPVTAAPKDKPRQTKSPFGCDKSREPNGIFLLLQSTNTNA